MAWYVHHSTHDLRISHDDDPSGVKSFDGSEDGDEVIYQSPDSEAEAQSTLDGIVCLPLYSCSLDISCCLD
jgi:hypothetical protein